MNTNHTLFDVVRKAEGESHLLSKEGQRAAHYLPLDFERGGIHLPADVVLWLVALPAPKRGEIVRQIGAACRTPIHAYSQSQDCGLYIEASNETVVEEDVGIDMSGKHDLGDQDANLMIKLKFLSYKDLGLLKSGMNKKVLKVLGIEQKVLDATTSNEPWGPHGSLLADIAQSTRNYGKLNPEGLVTTKVILMKFTRNKGNKFFRLRFSYSQNLAN